MVPRYFVARSSKPLPVLHSALLAYLADSFRIPFAGPDAALAVDRAGALHLFTAAVPECLPPGLRAELSRHELARSRAVRALPGASVWVMAVTGMDQPRGTPGLNDPIVIEGTLYGPYGGAGAPEQHAGGLTVTRGDLLSGFCDGATDAFTCSGLGGKPVRCLHAMLPAGETGRDDIVLAYLTTPAELSPTDAANEAMVAQLLFDVLVALQHDLRETDPAHAFAKVGLPVPDRAAVEEALERDGWEIRGEEAVKLDAKFKSGLGGLLTDVLGIPDGRKRKLPREAGVDEFLALAASAVGALGGWPNDRYRTMRQGMHSPPVSPNIPRESGTPPAAPPKPASDWRSDFGEPPAAKPRHSAYPSPAKRRPAWMDDFD